ncbi:potassium transporter Kup [Saccharicrinis sp. FJH54]|uniref:potassium transporter Kup n=1 Tax=Saccharicrinis sp. FJH54 TaxID=3344665 RepID=UPI0035D40D8F
MSDKKQTTQISTEEPDKLRGKSFSGEEPGGKALWLAALTVLGVVFGDIGTSPLYALQKCFSGHGSVAYAPENILGLLSLIFWSLVIIITVKYIAYVMRASNEREGGILALMALIEPAHPKDRRKRTWLIVLGVFGAALLYGDGMITPAISVLSAVEGLKVINPGFESYVIPVAVIILVLLFLFQKQGTAKVGSLFGPVMMIWFLVLLGSGIVGMTKDFSVIRALNPVYAVRFFLTAGSESFLVLGAIFLVVTGGEALYADIGHFGKKPIRLGWFLLVMPALVINYFGQGAVLLNNPDLAGKQVFYYMLPDWSIYPMVILSTIATVIASQAIISASFSLTRQAVILGYLPQLKLLQTSSKQSGQIYIPGINFMLMIAAIGLVIGFRKSVNLAGAYGVAVSMTMLITTILMFKVATEKWKWSLAYVIPVTLFFILIDISFLTSNMFKIARGGYFPIIIGITVFTLMMVWHTGTARMVPVGGKKQRSLKTFIENIKRNKPDRFPGTAVFMTSEIEQVSLLMMRYLEFFKVLNEKVILLNPEIMDEPKVPPEKRVEVEDLGSGITKLVVHFGFMENPNIPNILKNLEISGKKIELDQIVYYIEYPRMEYGGKWNRKKFIAKLYSYMARNAANPVSFFKIPYNQVLEVGVRVYIK